MRLSATSWGLGLTIHVSNDGGITWFESRVDKTIWDAWISHAVSIDGMTMVALDYEGMVVDIVYNSATLATLNQDKGIENIEIKLYPPQIKEYWDFSYKNFIDVLEESKKTLIQINKEEK